MNTIDQNELSDNKEETTIIAGRCTAASIYSEHLKNKQMIKEKKKMRKHKHKHKKKHKHKRKKYSVWIGDDVDYGGYDILDCTYSQPEKDEVHNIPKQLLLNLLHNIGFFFGVKVRDKLSQYVGMPQGMEGNILVIGGNGSGKSACIAIPTLITWHGAMCATDVKGELSDFYVKMYKQGLVTRPYIIFDPMQTDGIGYDPFGWVSQDKEENIVSNIQEIVMAIIPKIPNDKQPFWIETEQGVLEAALLYYFELGVGFIDAAAKILSSTVTSLCATILSGGNETAKMLLGNISENKPEVLACVDRGIRNKLMLFATDPHISRAFSGTREGAKCFTWNDLDEFNIFLRIPADKIEQWGGAVNLMYTQLIRHLERRPDKYSLGGADSVQTLLLMDEFARFGKLESITNAMSTLRSKNVNICLMLQSMAQLDKIYGEYDRRIIFDNCQYQAILRANDAETQKYFCELIGTRESTQWSQSESFDEFGDSVGYGKQISESREWVVYPHELATLEDILLLTPYGFCRLEKYQWYSNEHKQGAFIETHCTLEDTDEKDNGIVLEAKVVPVEDIKDGKVGFQTPKYIVGGVIEHVDH